MSVKRYELELYHCNGGEMLVSETGDYVSHDDYAELEQRLIESERYGRQTDITIDNLEMKLAQMAAENVGLKSAHPQPFGHEMMKALDAYMKHQDEVPEAGMLDAFFILRDSIRVDTTATDSFLAEVRAQGVDLICDYHKSRCEALHDVDRNGSHRHGAALCDAIDIAAQIRKGVQS